MSRSPSGASRPLAVGLAPLLVISLLTACSQTKVPAVATPSPTATPSKTVRVHISAVTGGIVTLAGVSLRLPPGSLDRDADVQLEIGRTPPLKTPALLRSAGPAVHGDLGGAHLSAPAILTIPVLGDVSAANIGYLNEQSSQWVGLKALANPASHTLALQVSHLSWYEPFTWDLTQAKTQLQVTLGNLLGYLAPLRADPPQCKAAPAGVKVVVTGGRTGDPSLDGCVEDAGGGKLHLRVVNNRPYGIALSPPLGSTQESVSKGGLLAALYQAKNIADVGGDYIPAGGSAVYLMAATGGAATATATWTWTTYTLDFAFAMLLAVAGQGEPPANSMMVAGTPATATRLSPVQLASLGQCLGDKISSDPPQTLKDAISGSLSCLSLLNDVWLAPLGVLQSLLVAIAGAFDEGQDRAAGGKGTVTIQRPTAKLVQLSGTCIAADLFNAAVAKEHFNPHDPGYRTAGANAGAYDPLCIGNWATASISRPNVGTTDGGTLFHRTSNGRWVETAAIEWPFVACALTQYGVPPADAVKLTRERAFSASECHS